MENHFPQATGLFCDKIDTSNTEEQQEILNVLTENIDIEPDAEVYDDDNIRDFPVKTKKDDDLTGKNNIRFHLLAFRYTYVIFDSFQ